ncbi:unnamed protein product, partial [Ostreobium quekettii]
MHSPSPEKVPRRRASSQHLSAGAGPPRRRKESRKVARLAARFFCEDSRRAMPGSLTLVQRLVDRVVAADGDVGVGSRRSLLALSLRLLDSGTGLGPIRDEASVAESVRSWAAEQGRSDLADRINELVARLAAAGLPPPLRASVLCLLEVVARQKRRAAETAPSMDSDASLRRSWMWQDGVGPLQKPVCYGNGRGSSTGTVATAQSSSSMSLQLQWCEGPTWQAREGALVRDVLFAVQGIDGTFVKFDRLSQQGGGFVIDPGAGIDAAPAALALRLCELGWLFRKVRAFVEGGGGQPGGSVRQALRHALSKEVEDYYRLMAVLEVQTGGHQGGRDVALSGGSSEEGEREEAKRRSCQSDGPSGAWGRGGGMSLRRLAVCLAEPTRRMRTLAVVVDGTRDKSGGALAGAVFGRLLHGAPSSRTFLKRILHCLSGPIYDMIKQWMFEGEFVDPYGEFFVAGGRGQPGDPWRDAYGINAEMLPEFIGEPMAKKILRAGKSVNFLREHCGDGEWVQRRATEARSFARMAAGTRRLECMREFVDRAASLLDRRLVRTIFEKYGFYRHCRAIRRYVLLGQGDFVLALMDLIKPELDKDASHVSEVALVGMLKVAAAASSSRLEEGDDALERLRVRNDRGVGLEVGWDVFSLEYDVGMPVSAVIDASAMAAYQRVSRLLWKLKRAEHNLSEYYVTFEVLEGAWRQFAEAAIVAGDLDELIEAHEAYLGDILARCLLTDPRDKLSRTLEQIFKCICRALGAIQRLTGNVDAVAHAIRVRQGNMDWRIERGGWGMGKEEGR